MLRCRGAASCRPTIRRPEWAATPRISASPSKRSCRAAVSASSGCCSTGCMRSAYDGITPIDGLATGAADGAEQPQVVMSEYGAGWVVSTRDGSNPLDANQIFAVSLANNAAVKGISRVDSLADSGSPDAVTGTAGLFSNVVAWQQTPAAPACPRSVSASRRRARAWGPRPWSPCRRADRPTPPTASTPQGTSTAMPRSHGCRVSPARGRS